MDLTPPSLTRSPSFSPPNSYCASDASSVDYPSPELVAQQYRIQPIYGVETGCSIPQSMDPEASLPSMDSIEQAEWGTATVMHATTTASPMPTHLTADYDHMANSYPSPLPAPFGNDMYGSQGARRFSGSVSPLPPPPAMVPSHSPAPSSTRTSISYQSPAPSIPSHYPSPSPRPMSSSYPPISTGYGSMPFVGGDQAGGWVKQDYPPIPEHEPFSFGGPGSRAPSLAPSLLPDARRAFRVVRPRRAPRRLTTKEEANYQCEVKGCGKLFSRSYNFKAHMETHDENREHPFPCTVGDCGKKFVRKTDLQRHHQSVHAKERNHKCDYCGRMFARKDTLRRHMEDGCSKRFDIGTLDLRPEMYDHSRTLAMPVSHLVSSSGVLPPLAMPPLGSNGMLAPSLRAGGEPSHGLPWLR